MKYEITKEQIKMLSDNYGNDNVSTLRSYLTVQLEEWFPEAFKQLPCDFTGWIKSKIIDNEKWLMYCDKGVLKYGFDANGDWFSPYGIANIKKSDIEATESEVFEALKNEAVKRGFVANYIRMIEGEKGKISNYKIDNNFEYDNGRLMNLSVSGYTIFKKGIWAEIIPTITKSEAEKLLNKKII